MSLKYEPASEPLHISVEWLFLKQLAAPKNLDGSTQLLLVHPDHPGGNSGANLKSIAHICHPILVAS